ncbi:MAG: helix-turn-helix domain-containing protein [Mesorhizobium sp.]|nr:MAG: helix-turn-helix domain-containing protein [Mesorhizobium sp.]
MADLGKTPWRKVHEKFGMSPAQFARELGRHRSKISRALSDEKGLISGKDQELILSAASKLNITITAADLTPVQ